jgi:hypothetical protein
LRRAVPTARSSAAARARDRDQSQPGTQSQPPRAEQNLPAQSSESAKREQEYLMALKRCESLGGADKKKCIDAAKKKYSEM